MDKRSAVRFLKQRLKRCAAADRSNYEGVIELLGGSSAPAHRPPEKVFGYHRRAVNQAAIADVVFGFLGYEKRLADVETVLATAALDDIDRRFYEERRDALRALVPRKRDTVFILASEWFDARGVKLSADKIKREFYQLTRRVKSAGFPIETQEDFEALKAIDHGGHTAGSKRAEQVLTLFR